MTLTNRRDDEEQIDPRVVAAIRAATRAEQDDEYESSTPGAGRWRERIASSRHDRGPTAATVFADADHGPDDATTRLAQRHRFGRTLDLPPVNREARGDWLIWLTLGGLVLWAIGAGVIWWLA